MAYPKNKQPTVVALAFLEFLRKESKLLGENYLLGITGFPAMERDKKGKT